MISNILKKDREALIKLHKAMTPEERLVAFFNHSRFIHRLYQAGKALRKASRRVKKHLKSNFPQ